MLSIEAGLDFLGLRTIVQLVAWQQGRGIGDMSRAARRLLRSGMASRFQRSACATTLKLIISSLLCLSTGMLPLLL